MNKIMENNEETTEEVVDTSTEDVKVEETSEEDTKDWKAEALKHKAIAERKEKKLQELKKPNTEQADVSAEDMPLYAKGLSVEEVRIIKVDAKLLGVTPSEAYENDIVRSKIDKARQEVQVKTNTLPPSGGSPPAPREKTASNMTDDEHRALWEEKSKGAING